MSESAELAIVLTAKDLATGVLSNVEKHIGSLGSAAKLASVGIAAIVGAGAAAFGAMTVLANGAAANASEVKKLKRELGLTAEEASKLRAAGTQLGIGVDDLSASFGIFSKNLISNRDKIIEQGVVVKTLANGNVDFSATLGGIADQFQGMPDGVEKTGKALELFGRGGKTLIPLLNKGSAGLKEMGEEAKKLGLVFDDKALAAATRYRQSQIKLQESVVGLKNTLGLAFMPILSDISEVFLNFALNVAPRITSGYEIVSNKAKVLFQVFKDGVAALRGEQKGGGDALASLIGPASAGKVMDLLTRVGAAVKEFWTTKLIPFWDWIKSEAPIVGAAISTFYNEHILPAFEYLKVEVPKAWDAFKDAVARAWQAAKPNLESLRDIMGMVAEKFRMLPKPLQQAIEATVLGTAAIKATGLDDTLSNIGNAVSGVSSVLGLFVTKGGWKAMATGIGIMAVPLALFAILLAFTIDFDGNVKRLADSLRAVGLAFDILGILAQKGLKIAGDAFSNLGTNVREAATEIKNRVGGVFDEIGTTVRDTATTIKNSIGGIFDRIGTRLDEIRTTFENVWQNISTRPGYWLGVAVGEVLVTLGNLKTGIKNVAGEMVKEFGDTLGHVKDFAGEFKTALKNAGVEGAKLFASGVMLLITSAGEAKTAIKNAMDKMHEDTVAKLGEIKDAAGQFKTDIKNSIGDFFEQLPKNVGEALDRLGTTIHDFFFGKIKDEVKSGFTGPGGIGPTTEDFFLSLPNKAWNWGVDLIKQFLGGLGSQAEAIGNFFSQFGTGIHNAITGNIPSITAPTPTNTNSGDGTLTAGPVTEGGPQALGGDYLVQKPTWFLAGEAGKERVTFRPQGNGNTGGEGGITVGDIHVHVAGSMDVATAQSMGDVIHDAITERLRSDFRRQGLRMSPFGVGA